MFLVLCFTKMIVIIIVIMILRVLLTCRPLGAAADVGVLSVLAGASVPAWLAQAFVDVGLTQPSGESRLAVAAEGSQAVDAGAVVTRVRETLIDVRLTVNPRVT